MYRALTVAEGATILECYPVMIESTPDREAFKDSERPNAFDTVHWEASVTALAVISAGVAFLSTTAAVQWLFKDKLVKKKRSGLQPTSDISGSKSVMLPNVTTTWIEGSCVYRVCFAELPFAKGVCKVSYEGWIVGDGPRTGCRVVVKTVPTDARTDARRWMPDRALADLAATFVHAFSKATDAAGIQHRSIDVVIPRIAQVAGGLLTVGQYVMIEPYLEGEFIKFNSNGGWE
uniref:Alpha-type protein kinase domain-containing protein n=1 Tax=Plectus sambesii TaxID=2011161 RepID=A0A914XGB2_9BILA